MKTVFLGTPPFAGEILRILASSEHEVVLAVSQPDKRAGRSRKMRPTHVRTTAEDLGIDVFQPENLNVDEHLDRIASYKPDILVVAAFGQILGEKLLHAFENRVINVHASLLPKYRGANPIACAILEGEKVTGVSIMRIVKKLDAGPVILQRKVEIDSRDTTGSLTGKLSILGGEALVQALSVMEKEEAVFTPQNEAEATYASRFEKKDGLIDWTADADYIERQVRAMNPWPGAYTTIERYDLRVTIKSSMTVDANGESGEVLKINENGILVAAGKGSILIESLQAAGKQECFAADFVRGRKLEKGDRFVSE